MLADYYTTYVCVHVVWVCFMSDELVMDVIRMKFGGAAYISCARALEYDEYLNRKTIKLIIHAKLQTNIPESAKSL